MKKFLSITLTSLLTLQAQSTKPILMSGNMKKPKKNASISIQNNTNKKIQVVTKDIDLIISPTSTKTFRTTAKTFNVYYNSKMIEKDITVANNYTYQISHVLNTSIAFQEKLNIVKFKNTSNRILYIGFDNMQPKNSLNKRIKIRAGKSLHVNVTQRMSNYFSVYQSQTDCSIPVQSMSYEPNSFYTIGLNKAKEVSWNITAQQT